MKKLVYFNIDGNLDYENALLKEWGIDDIELIEIKDKTSGALERSIADASGVVVEYENVTEEIMRKSPNLECASVQAIGYNNLDTEGATRNGICITNVPDYCIPEVALHAVGMAIDLVRKITYFDKTVRAGKWDPNLGYETERMEGKTFGMVYFGNIPKRMVPMLKALGLNILVFAPTKTAEYIESFGCKKAETLEELLRTSDFVSLHCPLIKYVTYHLMGEEQFKLMKPTAYFINTARGQVVDEAALARALREHWIKAAAVDVIEDELSEQSDLFSINDNLIITPHAAFISNDSLFYAKKRALQMQVQVLHNHQLPENLVNKEVIPKFFPR